LSLTMAVVTSAGLRRQILEQIDIQRGVVKFLGRLRNPEIRLGRAQAFGSLESLGRNLVDAFFLRFERSAVMALLAHVPVHRNLGDLSRRGLDLGGRSEEHKSE